MTPQTMPLSEVNSQAIRLLSEQLGVVNTLRFVNQFTIGHGNYTDERDALFKKLTLDNIVSTIEKKPPPNKPVNETRKKRRPSSR